MSIITSVFHIYGFLITEEAANLILRYTEEVFPDLYKEFSDPESLLAFQEYLCEKLDGCRYGTAESMTVWRIKDQEELDLNPGEEFYIIELKILPTYFHRRILLIRKLSKKFKKRLVNYFLPIFH